jgi:DNA adenine methylase
MINRIGKKTRIAHEIQRYFPPHEAYIELFFGAGGMYFNKPRANHNFLNDIDEDVYNFFKVFQEKTEELIEAINITPLHEKLFKEWVKGRQENTDVMKAVRFWQLSNCSLFGKGDTLHFDAIKEKEQVQKQVAKLLHYIKNARFTCCDFRKVLPKITFGKVEKNNCFIYADPPYVGTEDNYSSGFKAQDFIDLLDVLQASQIKFAVSEYLTDLTKGQAEKRGLNVYFIKEVQSIKSRNVEVLITNYSNPQMKLF